MRTDEAGFFYFVDRIGDNFRWKGENVATTEVATAITAFPGVKDASVYGVRLPGCEGAAGMAAIVTAGTLDLAEFRNHLARRLPAYARPVFLRVTHRLAATATFKHTKGDVQRAPAAALLAAAGASKAATIHSATTATIHRSIKPGVR